MLSMLYNDIQYNTKWSKRVLNFLSARRLKPTSSSNWSYSEVTASLVQNVNKNFVFFENLKLAKAAHLDLVSKCKSTPPFSHEGRFTVTGKLHLVPFCSLWILQENKFILAWRKILLIERFGHILRKQRTINTEPTSAKKFHKYKILQLNLLNGRKIRHMLPIDLVGWKTN